MKLIIPCLSLLLILSCKQKQNTATNPQSVAQIKDSLTAGSDRKTVYVERGHLDLEKYFITVKSKYLFPDSIDEDSSFYAREVYLIVRNKADNTTDSLPIETGYNYFHDMKIEDYSDSLHFNDLLLRIDWIGDSDMEESFFVEYDNHSIKGSFGITELVFLERKDEWTLSGFVAGRDEIVYAAQTDYPLTVSLKDYKVYTPDPPKQRIGWWTKAFTNIKVYRDSSLNEASAYIIKKGKEFDVDTLYRTSNIIRLIVSDTIILYSRPEKLRDKVRINAAG
jgi:hypothetical protein